MSAAPGRGAATGQQSFKYNDRVAFALVPTLIILAGMVEAPSIAILVVRLVHRGHECIRMRICAIFRYDVRR